MIFEFKNRAHYINPHTNEAEKKTQSGGEKMLTKTFFARPTYGDLLT